MQKLRLADEILERTLLTVGENKHEIAHKLLSCFFDELVEYQTVLASNSPKDSQELIILTHKMAGGCSYFGTKHLHHLLLQYEGLARASQKEALEELRLSLLESIEEIVAQKEAVMVLLANAMSFSS